VNTADHVTVLTHALEQLPEELRSRVLVRGDSGAGTHAFVEPLHELNLHYSVGLVAGPRSWRRWRTSSSGMEGRVGP